MQVMWHLAILLAIFHTLEAKDCETIVNVTSHARRHWSNHGTNCTYIGNGDSPTFFKANDDLLKYCNQIYKTCVQSPTVGVFNFTGKYQGYRRNNTDGKCIEKNFTHIKCVWVN